MYIRPLRYKSGHYLLAFYLPLLLLTSKPLPKTFLDFDFKKTNCTICICYCQLYPILYNITSDMHTYVLVLGLFFFFVTIIFL